ncbi:hypothetical protein QN326_00090 [Candidatus Phytoplasma asteris]|uniref:Uncharacterized protein n=2 Tax=16SrI (Aster yellows group) TaxID=3042590 RepID=A0A859I8D5_9MOLU|nr:MAG: hypothetical protein RP166_0090 [Rapeseed phyllody phytoplasma]
MFMYKNNLDTNTNRKAKNVFSKKFLVYVPLIISFITSLLAIDTISYDKNKRNFFTLGLFTRQNTLSVNIFLLLSLNNKFKKSKYYLYLSFVCLINCLIVMFFCLIETKTGTLKINYFFEHKILSLMFIFYYFFRNKSIIKLKKNYVGIIYPLIYFLIMFILIKIDNEKLNPYSREITKYEINEFMLLFYAFLTSIMILIISFYTIILKNKIIKNNDIVVIKKYKRWFYFLSILVLSFFVFFNFIK